MFSKGARQPSPGQRLNDPHTTWHHLTIPWYGGETKQIEFATGCSRWYRQGLDPMALRWMLIRCPDHSFLPTALFCSDQSVNARQIILWFIARWNRVATKGKSSKRWPVVYLTDDRQIEARELANEFGDHWGQEFADRIGKHDLGLDILR